MDEINIRVGRQIRRYRKAARWTLQQLADAIHKSRATVCKYERGEIAADVSTLGDISGALQVPLSQLVSFPPEESALRPPLAGPVRQSPFFQARRLYFYFYDGRYHRLKDGVIDIQEETEQPGRFTASLTIYLLRLRQRQRRGGLLYRERALQRHADPLHLCEPV